MNIRIAMNIKRYISTLFVLFLTINTIFGQNKKAFFVCISNYPKNSAFEKINGTNDYNVVSKQLINQGFTVNKLLDEEATANNIKSKLNLWTTNLKKGDCAYLHFSTHGQPFEDQPPYDEADFWDESIVAFDAKKYYEKGVYEGQNHITDDVLAEYFSKIRQTIGNEGFLIVVIDACHSGGMSRDEDFDDEITIRGTNIGFSKQGKIYLPKISSSGNFDEYIKLKQNSNWADILILEACKEHQFNREITVNGQKFGPLSYYLSTTLKEYKIEKSLDWVKIINQKMDNDSNLENQNMVIETSLLN